MLFFNRKKPPVKYASKKENKTWTSEEVLKDRQMFLDEEDNEDISDEDVHLDELNGEKIIFVLFYQYIASNF